mgnify:CR=1 FL=1
MPLQPKSYLVPINLNKNEIRQAVLENSTSAPSSPVKGQIYYDSTNNLTAVYNGTIFQSVAVTQSTLNVFASTTSAQLASVISDETGSGNLVFSTSPVLTTPNLGTPSFATLTNATGLPVATGISGLGTNVAAFLATPNSLNFLNTVTDETGTGSVVFSTNPVLTTPNLGVPSFVTLTNATGLPVATGISGLGTNVATFLATPSSLNLLNALTNKTGTGNNVFDVSPSLVTPNIGAATGTSLSVTGSLTSTVATGTAPLVVSSTTEVTNLRAAVATTAYGVAVANVTGLGTNVATFLATPTSANFANVITNETGTGNVVFSVSPTFTGNVTVPTPTAGTDAANKNYVDQVAQGVNAHDAVQAATTGNLVGTYTAGSAGADGGSGVGATFAITATGVTLIDGVTLALNDRVLVKNQTDSTQNGLYYVSTVGTTGVSMVLTRSLDGDNSVAGDITAGDLVYVLGGSTNGTTSWVQTATGTATTPNKGIKIGTDAITWTQFAGASTTSAGAGLSASGNVFNVGTNNTGRIVVNADDIDLATVSQSNTTPAATTTFITSHTVDAYGRITGTNTASVQDATTAAKGIASFNSTAFSVTAGAVTLVSGASGARSVIGAVGKYTATNASLTPSSGSVTWSIPASTHLLGATPGLIVQVRDTATTAVVDVDMQVNETTGDVTLNWVSAATVTAGAYRVTIIG